MDCNAARALLRTHGAAHHALVPGSPGLNRHRAYGTLARRAWRAWWHFPCCWTDVGWRLLSLMCLLLDRCHIGRRYNTRGAGGRPARYPSRAPGTAHRIPAATGIPLTPSWTPHSAYLGKRTANARAVRHCHHHLPAYLTSRALPCLPDPCLAGAAASMPRDSIWTRTGGLDFGLDGWFVSLKRRHGTGTFLHLPLKAAYHAACRYARSRRRRRRSLGGLQKKERTGGVTDVGKASASVSFLSSLPQPATFLHCYTRR